MKLTALILTLFLALPVFASNHMDMEFSCGGILQIGDNAIEETAFTISYTNFVPEDGYQNETLKTTLPVVSDISIKSFREESADNPNCVQFEELVPKSNKNFSYYKFAYTQTCGADKTFHTKIEAYCDKVK